MERLTKRDGLCVKSAFRGEWASQNILHKLADYEDAEEQGLLTKIVYGEWVDTEPDYHNGYYRNAHKCSNCQDYYTTEYNEMNYCPNCGAKMKTKEEAEQKLAEMKGEQYENV